MNPHALNQLHANSDAVPIPWAENYDAVIAKKIGGNDNYDAVQFMPCIFSACALNSNPIPWTDNCDAVIAKKCVRLF